MIQYCIVHSGEAAAQRLGDCHDELCLPYDSRKKSRLKAITEAGEEVGLFLQRGTVLADGDVLESDEGQLLRIRAAQETLSRVSSENHWALMRAAYHLGNRHMPLQIDADTLCYQHDHVLDKMVRGLGLEVEVVQQAFHPESGAYSGGGGDHGHHH